MSVLTCRREGCDNIMCNKYSNKFGYICDDCFEEMKLSRLDIKTFMNSLKGSEKLYDYDEEFEQNYRNEK